RLARHVAGDEVTLDLVGDRLAARLVEVHRDDGRALRPEPASGGPADPAARPGDDGDPIRQPTLHDRLLTVYSELKNTFFTSANDASASGPSSRPSPDCFIPPNGVQ